MHHDTCMIQPWGGDDREEGGVEGEGGERYSSASKFHLLDYLKNLDVN